MPERARREGIRKIITFPTDKIIFSKSASSFSMIPERNKIIVRFIGLEAKLSFPVIDSTRTDIVKPRFMGV